jgi:hypothetical protein
MQEKAAEATEEILDGKDWGLLTTRGVIVHTTLSIPYRLDEWYRVLPPFLQATTNMTPCHVLVHSGSLRRPGGGKIPLKALTLLHSDVPYNPYG